MATLSLRSRLILVLALLCTALFCVSTFGSRPGTAAGAEYITTYAADCVTPQTVFYLGDTVCAEAGNYPLPLTTRFRRFQWVAPDNSIARLTSVRSDPQFVTFVIPSTGDLAQPGTWRVTSIDASGEGFAVARFVVRSPWFRLADLWVTKTAPDLVLPGDKILYTLQIGNPGPDFGEGVEFVTEVPSNMIFLGLRQAAGPAFECSTPGEGGTGRTICQTKGLGMGEQAEFHFYYQVNPDAKEGTTCSAGSSVTSYYTEERNKGDNFWTTEVTVASPNPNDGTDGGPGEEP